MSAWDVTKSTGLGVFRLQLNADMLTFVAMLAKSMNVRQCDIIASMLNCGSIALIKKYANAIPEEDLATYQEWAENGGE